MLSRQNKKQTGVVSVLMLLALVSGVFFLVPSVAHAADGVVGALVSGGNAVVDALLYPVKAVLYGIFVVLGLVTSAAVTTFEWAINPDYISGPNGLLNRSSVYAMWKFIRDFFNLFFILTLLYTAFTIIFQVAKDYKKTLLSLVLAALFVNFSFPITRLIIDVTNVPMYYFVNQIAANKTGETVFGNFLGASQIKEALIPDEKSLGDMTMWRIIAAIMMLFLFSTSLMVLAVLMVVRLVALILLLIFSSVGFAASVIPGLQKYSGQWWEKLWQYTLFGPSAMLMLYVATSFFAEIGKDDTKKQFFQAAMKNSTQNEASFIGSLAMFSVPIIMMWFAISLGSSFSIAGAGVVVGTGQKFAKWAGKKVAYNNPVGRGIGSGLKKAAMDGKFLGFDYGKRAKMLTGNYWASPSKVEASIKGYTTGRTGGAKTELQKVKDKSIHEQIGKDKENKLSRSDALKRLDSTDDVMRISAAASLANMDSGIQNMDDLTRSLEALKKVDPATGRRTVMDPNYTEKALEIISKADKKIIAATPATATSPAQTGLQNLQTVISSLGNNEKAVKDLIDKLDDSAFNGSAADYSAVRASVIAVKPALENTLESKVRKEGEAKVLADYQMTLPGATVNAVVQGILGSMRSIEDMVAAKSLFQDPRYQAEAVRYVTTQPLVRYQEIKKVAANKSPAVFALI